MGVFSHIFGKNKSSRAASESRTKYGLDVPLKILGIDNRCRILQYTEFYNRNHDELFHDGGSYQIETSILICSANQWTGFYMLGTSVMKELMIGIEILFW